MTNHDHTKMQQSGCKDCNEALSADKNGFLLYKGKYYVVMVTHPNMPRPSGNAKQRKRHLALSPEEGTKSLCNMFVDFGEEKLNWDSPMQYVKEPYHGAGETCKLCWDKVSV